ncbi:MAG: hypothetical protein LBT56_01905 [Prevotellaceae bacterium]|jgi:hypothetical protein|nr:hypothetical protein [Prevotellaceae bacterium]
MNKNTIIVFILLVFSVSSLTGQNEHESKYDYITSSYYQLVYEADVAYLEGNDSLAFAKLQEAERRCPLINQFEHREIELYCCLLMKNRQYEKAIAYMDTLAVAYGSFPFRALAELGKDSILTRDFLINNPDFYNKIFPELLAKRESFYTPERDSLVKNLRAMSEDDQKVRKGMDNKKTFNKKTFDYKTMYKTDSINKIKLLQIIEKYGFPNASLYVDKDSDLHTRITAMCVHFWKDKEFGKMLLRFVHEGKCGPEVYGFFVDKEMLEEHKKLIFGVFNHTKKKEVKDFKNLNKRRISIGMPTREMEQRRNELIEQGKHNE